jgi:hypothetical protein
VTNVGLVAGAGPGRTTGPAASEGLVGTPFPVPACVIRGAVTGATGGAPRTGAPPAGSPAGTTGGTAAGTGMPSAGGPGRTTGAAGAASPDIWSTQAAPPGAVANLSTHAAPPPADASGLKVKAAPHNPALAATVMPNKSKIFNANSPAFGFRGGISATKGCVGTVSLSRGLS